MRVRRKLARRARRPAPAVRRGSSAGLMVGGARDAAETQADRLAAQVLSPRSRAGTGQCVSPPVRSPCCKGRASGGGGAVARRQSANPTIAAGSAATPAGPAISRAVSGLGAGRPLAASARAFFEPRFGRDLSGVRVHTGAPAARATRALGAFAFARGRDIAFGPGSLTRRRLAHELAHVVTEGDGAIRRDLCREPPGRTAEPDELTESEKADAARYNNDRFDNRSTEIILDMMGAAGRTSFTAEMSAEIQSWQADFRLDPDGKVGLLTLETLSKAMIACGMRNPVIRLIIDGHNFTQTGVASISYDRRLTTANASTGGAFGSPQTIRVGPPGFRQGYRGLVHTIRHELVHAADRSAGSGGRTWPQFDAYLEFRGEATEIISAGMLLEGLPGLFDDALRGINHWDNMTAADQAAEADRFRAARRELLRRWNAAPAAQQTAARQAIINRWNAVTP